MDNLLQFERATKTESYSGFASYVGVLPERSVAPANGDAISHSPGKYWNPVRFTCRCSRSPSDRIEIAPALLAAAPLVV